jgi:hypothetical protein
MDKRIIITVACSALGLVNSSGFAQAEMIGRLECNVAGPVSQEPIGDKDGHLLVSAQYSCRGVEGLLKDATYSGISTSEWDGPQGKFLSGGGIIRAASGLAVTQLIEGVGFAKPALSGIEAFGKGLIKYASGTLAALSGKADKWEAEPTGFGRFSLEVTTDEEVSTVGTSKQ